MSGFMKRQVDQMPEGGQRVIGLHRIEEKFETVDQDDGKKKDSSPKNQGIGLRFDGEA
jgi:hypothetical protein